MITELFKTSPRCIGWRCDRCYENVKTCREIKELLLKKIDVKLIKTKPEAAAVNLCEEAKDIAVAKEVMVNYTYTDLGRQMMILDIGAPLSPAGFSWMTQYLEEF